MTLPLKAYFSADPAFSETEITLEIEIRDADGVTVGNMSLSFPLGMQRPMMFDLVRVRTRSEIDSILISALGGPRQLVIAMREQSIPID